MISVEKTTAVHRPSDEVFAFVADQTNAARWQSGIVEVRRLTDGPPGGGIRHSFTRMVARVLGRDVVGNLARLKSILESRPAAAPADMIGAG